MADSRFHDPLMRDAMQCNAMRCALSPPAIGSFRCVQPVGTTRQFALLLLLLLLLPFLLLPCFFFCVFVCERKSESGFFFFVLLSTVFFSTPLHKAFVRSFVRSFVRMPFLLEGLQLFLGGGTWWGLKRVFPFSISIPPSPSSIRNSYRQL